MSLGQCGRSSHSLAITRATHHLYAIVLSCNSCILNFLLRSAHTFADMGYFCMTIFSGIFSFFNNFSPAICATFLTFSGTQEIPSKRDSRKTIDCCIASLWSGEMSEADSTDKTYHL